MNKKEIVFIICRNNALWFDECVRYIQDLYIPEGYTVDILSIEDADSIPLAYNAAIKNSKAKYKIYLHQDTFILHRNLVSEILKIFNEDNSIGMIGMVGCRKVSTERGDQQHWDLGRVYLDNGLKMTDQDLRDGQDKKEKYVFAESVDAFFMATQYDFKWQEELADEASCVASYSLEMLRHEKRIIIPWQEEPWCCHREDEGEEVRDLREQMIRIAEEGAYDVIWQIIDEIRGLKGKESRAIAGLTEIYELEKASRQGLSSEWWMLHEWHEIYNYYNWVRFVLMRMTFQREDERIQELELLVKLGKIHKDAVLYLAGTIWSGTDRICSCLQREQREEPLVSVILSVYNGADFVGKTIESILGQTYYNMEIIIVDDASTDHSLEILRSCQDSRIKVIACEKNRNVAYSGNVGFKEAKGKYVALIGHDDLWKRDKLEKQVAFLEEHPSYSVCFTCMDVIDENLKICKDSFLYQVISETDRPARVWIRKLFMEGNFFCAPSACIRKEALDRAGYYRLALLQLQDYDLWLRLFLQGEAYIYPEKLTCYRQFKNKSNLSAMSNEAGIRGVHEKQYICNRYIKEMSRERFIDIFAGEMLNSNAYDEKEILCEKALFLWRKGFYSGHYDIAELLDDDECRQILEENYQFDLALFYKLNAKPVHFE